MNEEASLRMNAARPLFQIAERLELLPILRSLENIDVRFGIAGRLLALQFFRDDAIMKLCLHRNRRRHVAVNEMIDEMLGLAVFPLLRMNGERFRPERVGIALAEP